MSKLIRPSCVKSNLNIVKFHDQVHQLFFPDEDSRKKALECGPWCFDNYLFIIKPWDPAMKTPNYEFKSILTVCPLNFDTAYLPRGYHTVDVGYKIVSSLSHYSKFQIKLDREGNKLFEISG